MNYYSTYYFSGEEITSTSSKVLCINGQVSIPDYEDDIPEPVPVEICYISGRPVQWKITDGGNLTKFSILLPLCLPALQFIIAGDSDTFFNGSFYSTATVMRNGTSFILNITGNGVTNGNSISFDAEAYGDFDLTSYTYNLSAVSFSYEVHEDTPGRVVLSTSIEDDLPLSVTFQYDPRGTSERPFDNQQLQIDQTSISTVNNNILVFNATSSLEPVTSHTLCAIGNVVAPIIPPSSVKVTREITVDESGPTFWEINIPENGNPRQYARVLPLLMTPVSLLFSSNVLEVVGDTVSINVTLTVNNHDFTLIFTSMGLVNSNESEDVEILNFNARTTGQLRRNYDRGFGSDSISISFREETAGNLEGRGKVGRHTVRLYLRYNNKTSQARFTDVRLTMNHSTLDTTNNVMRFDLFSELVGWDSSCPIGSGGFKCYACRRGYFGRPKNGRPCTRCRCNEHSNRCHPRTGRCFNCANNTEGRHCHICADRFYGNATNNGTCKRK